MHARLLPVLLRRRRIARKRCGDLVGAVDRKQLAQKNQMEAARIDMAERTQLQAFFRRNALVVEINAVAAHVLNDPAVAVFCQDKMRMADIRAIEPDIGLLCLSDDNARQPAEAEFFKLQLPRRGFPDPCRELFSLSPKKAVDRRLVGQLHGGRAVLCGKADLRVLEQPPMAVKQLQLQLAGRDRQLRGKLKLVFPVVFRRQKDLTVGIRKIQVQNILLHVASSFSALMVSLARIRLSVTGVMPRKVATSLSCMMFCSFG